MAAPQGQQLFGRKADLRVAEAALDALVGGSAVTLVVEGEGGIGKTALMDWLARCAEAQGVAVYHGEAHPFERAQPFSAIAQALDLRPRSSDPRRAQVGRMLGGTEVALGDPRGRVVEMVLDLLDSACSRGPVLLIVEDLHWADVATLAALRAIAQELVHEPLMVAVSLRPEPRSPELDVLLDELRSPRGRWLRMAELPQTDVVELAGAALGDPPGSRLSAALAKAGGNPLLVVEMLRSLRAEGQLVQDAGVVELTGVELSTSLRDLIVRRLRYLPDATLELLQLAAVLGDSVSVGTLIAMSGRRAAEVAAQLQPAFRSGLLGEHGDTVVFRHQLVHDAIYDDIPRPIRQALHRNAADALASTGADPLVVASQLIRGAKRGDLDAIARLREAARAGAARDPGVAVQLLVGAESLLPAGHPEADTLSADIADAMLRAGSVADAAARVGAVLDRRHDESVDGRLRLTLIGALSLQNRSSELVRRADEALARPGSLSSPAQAFVLAQASLGHTFEGNLVEGEASAWRALSVAERAQDPEMIVWALAALSVTLKWQGRYGEALAHTRRGVTVAEQSPGVAARMRHPKFFLAMVLADADLIDEARIVHAELLAEFADLGSGWLAPDTLQLSGATRYLTGEWDDALAGLEAGLATAEALGIRTMIPQTRAYLGLIALGRGDHDAAERALAPLGPDLSSHAPPFNTELAVFAAALLADATGAAASARAIALPVWKWNVAHESRYWHRYLGPLVVRLALALGDVATAEQATAAVEAGALLAPEVPSVVSAALRCRGLVDRDPEVMIRAVETAAAGPRVIDHALVCEEAGELLMACGRRDDAVPVLEWALERYEAAGAVAWAQRVAAFLRRNGVRRGVRGPRRRPTHGWESLTPTERHVCELVAGGLTNREVARRLHVSPHTVNTHLRHVFDKLEVRNRAALAALVTRQLEAVD